MKQYLIIWIPFLGTTLGSAMVFFMRKEMNQKLEKLERAMHAAKMAGIASEMVNTRGQSPFPRR